jgi:hypothetical protein
MDFQSFHWPCKAAYTGGWPHIMEYPRAIEWRGFLNVELDASPWRPPIDSARITARYFREVLHLDM